MRFIAIDLGGKRTGLAVGDRETGVITPLTTIEVPNGERLIEAVARVVDTHRPDVIIVGLPLNMDGSEGEAAKSARAFGAGIGQACGVPVEYQDERLTSFAAEEQLARSGHTHRQKKRRRDALAAAQILRDYLDEPAT